MLYGNTPSQRGNSHHECIRYREGDWIVLVCRTCKNYEKRFNWKTGEIRINHSPLSEHTQPQRA